MKPIICKTIEEVTEKLNSLGITAASIARTLDALKCSGCRTIECNCPIAIFLRQYCGLIDVMVKPDYISFKFQNSQETIVYVPPGAVLNFIVRFDRGDFLYLVTDLSPKLKSC